MNLYKLFEDIKKPEFSDTEVSMITDDSRKIQKDCVFFCVKGGSFDGHTKAAEAIEKGAAAVVTERDMGLKRQIIVENSRKAYGTACATWFDHPERKLRFIGVTGTNGKTTMTNVIKHILTYAGFKTGLIGTIHNEIGDEIVSTQNTTPMAYEYMSLLDRMAKEGCDVVIMEVSSFGLVQYRTGPTKFDISVFTNLTQDHLDYHGTMEEYFKAKKMLFDISDVAICNIDDSYGKRLYDSINIPKYTFSRKSEADFYAHDISLYSDKTVFKLCHDKKESDITVSMTGMFNVENITAAVAVCSEFGVTDEKITDALSVCRGVKGRCEIIPTGKDFTVICDYAHTPDALENVLASVKQYCQGRLICLFGCGGNRDRGKRPLMAQSATKYADMLIVTSDNPRDEDPNEIISDILSGIKGTNCPYITVTDRKEAIFEALKTAGKNDIVLLAGKGHEDYQVLENNVHIHFDEREIVAEGLSLL